MMSIKISTTTTTAIMMTRIKSLRKGPPSYRDVGDIVGDIVLESSNYVKSKFINQLFTRCNIWCLISFI